MNRDFTQLQQAMANTPSFDGQPAELVYLTNANGMTVTLMDMGATWLSCTLLLNGAPREVLLRSLNMYEHKQQGAYFGAMVGRFANRLAKGQFEVNGQRYQLAVNNGDNALHGGVDGFDKRRWCTVQREPNMVEFALHSPDGDQGYPGNVDVKVRYTLSDDNEVMIDEHATSDQSCPLNLTNHAYFNLAGEASENTGLEHRLQMNAEHYLPTDAGLIPTGEYKPVAGTSFDFRQPKRIADEFLSDGDQKIAAGYDHSFVLNPPLSDGKDVAAVLFAPNDDVRMNVRTTKPGIQFYSGNFLLGTPGASKVYQNHDGLALEAQYFPDGPNKPEWGLNNGVLSSKCCYQHRTVYEFEF
ncbi:galactose-1-epimerase [Salinivibrio kushneri]|uniref:galactose-1-epimerase n=1 Tax=Salinivibrio kushneri TaxID=1908198 RepID=UPI0022B3DC66|nr:galactose-1-epimerase [Salinivibrio kushneri]WBA19313.1 galactose-1-epimerase [Salinivibrio kushneri]